MSDKGYYQFGPGGYVYSYTATTAPTIPLLRLCDADVERIASRVIERLADLVAGRAGADKKEADAE